jgi:collagenase-like PrtC family protease
MILAQVLSDLENLDEETQMIEAERLAFEKLLYFRDSRCVLASITGRIALENDKAVPLSEEDLSHVQSFFPKLEPICEGARALLVLKVI